MNVVDTSAVVSVLFREPGYEEIMRKLMTPGNLMSAATWVELGIVIEARKGPSGAQLLDELMKRTAIQVVPVDRDIAEEAVVAWRRFGKGRHPAGLNLGDTFSYALAQRRGLPLLCKGDDFSRTDVAVA